MEGDPSTGKPPTILDVAKRANVSKSTVSNVIRGAPNITPKTHAKVTKAIEELGYRPNFLARQMVHQRTTIFGVMVGDLANPFYAEGEAIERFAAARGFRVISCNTQARKRSKSPPRRHDRLARSPTMTPKIVVRWWTICRAGSWAGSRAPRSPW